MRRERFYPWAVVGCAFAVRALYLRDFWQGSPFARVSVSDARVFDGWALRVANGDWLGGAEVFALPPLYPYLLGLFYFLFGHAPGGAQALQALIGCGSALLAYRLGRRHFGAGAGLAGGLLFACYGPEVFEEGVLLGTSWAVFFCLAGLALLDLTLPQPRGKALVTPSLSVYGEGGGRGWVRFALAGLAFGLAALLRPNALSAAPLLFVWVWWEGRRRSVSDRAALRAAGLALAGLLVPLALCMLRNGWAAGEWTTVTAHGGINFYMGNHPGAPGWFSSPPGVEAHITPEGPQGNLEGPRRAAEAALGRALTASEVSGYWFRKGLAFMADHPGEALGVTLRKARLFFSGYEVPLNTNFYYQRRYSPLLRLPWGDLWALFPLALVGMWLAARQAGRHALLYLFLAGYAAGVVLFHVSSRYRMPAVPVLALFAGYAVSALVTWGRGRDFRRLAAGLAALALLTGAYRLDLAHWMRQNDLSLDPFNLGTSYLYLGENGAAAARLEEARGLGGDHPSLHYHLGLAYGRLGRSEEAMDAYRRAISQNPEMAAPYTNLGNISFRQGRYREAAEAYRDALARDPTRVNAWANLGWACLSLGDPEGARRAWEEALRRDPAHPSAQEGMARLGQGSGDGGQGLKAAD
jgi:tetratricopeptide (TPR) repeat protein